MQAGAPQEVTRAPTSEVVPGEDKAMKTKLFELGSKAMQSLGPVNSINMHLCGLAFYADNPERQVELHHYCTNLNDEVTQCVVYDSDKPDARLVGVEYVISHRLFNNLDPEEQKLWHSHQTDVKTASFIAPELPERIDRALMSKLANTYGKTWVLWQTDKGDPLPLGGPQLMMVKTKTEDWNPQLFAHRDQRLGMNSHELRERRKEIETSPVHPHADAWEKGDFYICKLEKQSGLTRAHEARK